MNRVDLGGHTLHVDSHGSGPREFICLHGLVDDGTIWRQLAPALAERGRVTCLDQRGHGRSDSPPGPYLREALAADAIGVCDALGFEKAILVGHSMGGIISMTAALDHPERVAGLVLIGTASRCNEKTAAWYERIASAGERDGTAGLSRAIYGAGSTRAIAGDAAGISHVTRTLKTLYEDPLTPRLSSVSCPVLLLVGEKDPMGPKASEQIAAALPAGGATLEVFPGAGHWLHVERPDAVLESIDRWLAATEKEAR